MSSIGILSSSLAGKNECELCEKSFACLYKTAKKDKLVSHQKVHTKSSCDQLSP